MQSSILQLFQCHQLPISGELYQPIGTSATFEGSIPIENGGQYKAVQLAGLASLEFDCCYSNYAVEQSHFTGCSTARATPDPPTMP